MEPMTIHFISAVPTKHGRSVRGCVRAESKAQRNGEPATRISLVVLIARDIDAGIERSLPERVYDEALKYLDIA